MPDLNEVTMTNWTNNIPIGSGAHLTIFEGDWEPYFVDLNQLSQSFGTSLVYGRQNHSNSLSIQILFNSGLVSRPHGTFIKEPSGKWKITVYKEAGNGIIVNNTEMRERILQDGDEIRIDNMDDPKANGVLMLFSAKRGSWNKLNLEAKDVTIGRNKAENNLCLSHISVSKKHAIIKYDGGRRVLQDLRSQNGLIVNGKRMMSRELRDRDVIRITSTKLIYCKDMIRYSTSVTGESIEASGLCQIQSKKGLFDFEKKKMIMHNASLRIDPGELVAIVGGSGAGKSTLMYMLCGLKKPHKGQVSIGGTDLFKNFDSLKAMIGYVPQADIVQNNLTVRDMLLYSAKLRVQGTPKELEDRINKAIKDVKLEEHVDKYIRKLSGGQKKRVSIAVELLADPKLFFLDEPGSGLDPYTEESLMITLREMANSGKTVVFVTHSPLSLQNCDKIVFIGKGGHLCFYGGYEQAIRFLCKEEVKNGQITNPKKFNPNDLVRVYEHTTEEAEKLATAFNMGRKSSSIAGGEKGEKKPPKKSFVNQTGVLFSRNLKIYFNDSGKLRGAIFLTLVLAVLVSIVANGSQYDSYGMTKSLYFALTCAVFFVGCMNSITEVCKERNLIKREYMTTLSLGAYILAKTAMLLLLCLAQSIIFAVVFAIGVGLPKDELMFSPFLEIFLTIFLTGMAGSSMGMFVSCFSKNEDKASKLAPILLLPQMLFSGVIFELGNDILKFISYIATSRWSMEAFGSFVNLNIMDAIMGGNRISRAAEDMFEYTERHATSALIMIALFSVVFSIISVFALLSIKNSED